MNIYGLLSVVTMRGEVHASSFMLLSGQGDVFILG